MSGSDRHRRLDGLIGERLASAADAATLIADTIRWGEIWPAFDDDDATPITGRAVLPRP